MQKKDIKPEEGKKGPWKKFLTFLMYGGWLAILLAIFAIYITVTIVTSGQS
ncbi:MAG: hypothetical protein JW882_12250 [Deltaproteobacteria bacterium]|nr:hypothetical protein [Deltaproteobacteria bacterium]